MLSKDDYLSCVRQNLMLLKKVPGRTAPQEFKKIVGVEKVKAFFQTQDTRITEISGITIQDLIFIKSGLTIKDSQRTHSKNCYTQDAR